MHRYEDLIQIFNDCFSSSYNTQLICGEEEPIYLPANENRAQNLLCFAQGFFSSALHESAHWLIAGSKRRKLVDFGYWYLPDGRNAEQQALFQTMEVKPQAMEWILSKAAGHPFHLSLDNLSGEPCALESFREAVYQQVWVYCTQGLPLRARQFRDALCRFYQRPLALSAEDFSPTPPH